MYSMIISLLVIKSKARECVRVDFPRESGPRRLAGQRRVADPEARGLRQVAERARGEDQGARRVRDAADRAEALRE